MSNSIQAGVVSKKGYRLMRKSFEARYPQIKLSGRVLSPGQFHHFSAFINTLVNSYSEELKSFRIPLEVRCSPETFYEWLIALNLDPDEYRKLEKEYPDLLEYLESRLDLLRDSINCVCKACGMMRSVCKHEGYVIFEEDLPLEERVSAFTDEPKNILVPKAIVPLVDQAKLAMHKKCMSSSFEKNSQIGHFFNKLLSPDGHLRPLRGAPKTIDAILVEFLHKFPNFVELHELLESQFALIGLSDAPVCLPPVLLAGPPGVGKTEALRWLCNALQLHFEVIDMSTAQEAFLLTGTDIRYSGSQPGVPLTALVEHDCANPLILLDELDKAFLSRNGISTQPLLTFLERKSAKRFKDLAAGFEVDASYINWFATANDISLIAPPILSRMTLIKVKAPTAEQIGQVAKCIYQDLVVEIGCDHLFPASLDNDVIAVLMDSTPRVLKRLLRQGLGRAAKEKRLHLLPSDIDIPIKTKKVGIGFLS